MISIYGEDGFVYLDYKVENASYDWVLHEFENGRTICLLRTFFLRKKKLIGKESEGRYLFVIGELIGEYYKIDSEVLDMTSNFYIHRNVKFSVKSFVAHRNISIPRKLSNIIDGDIYVGGEHDGNIPESAYFELIKEFPNSYELDRYTESRISLILSEYINQKRDFFSQYNKYMNKKVTISSENILGQYALQEIIKYENSLLKLNEMLVDYKLYNENSWQKEVLQIVLLLFPKYIYVAENVKIKDEYRGKDRFIDIILVDYDGNLDIIEIKQPFEKCIVTNNGYRENYIPLKELSGSIMQVEKYIFHLNKSGVEGERLVSQRLFPNGEMSIKITNPNGIVLLGRSHNLTDEQRHDFEIIKRKYKHIIDIITYDDLLNRLENLIKFWKLKAEINPDEAPKD